MIEIECREVLKKCSRGHLDFRYNFGKCESKKDGLRIYCKTCRNRITRENYHKDLIETRRKENLRQKIAYHKIPVEDRKLINHIEYLKYKDKNIMRSLKRSKTPEGRFYVYFKKAKDRGIPFELNFNTFMLYWQKDCTYCGSKIETIGIDVLDRNIGYKEGYITPCCSICNRMKLNFRLDDFMKRCQSISNRFPNPSRFAVCTILYNQPITKQLLKRYDDYKRGAFYRNIDFNLSIEEFSRFWGLPCFYCGTEIETIGLDRILNNHGYRISNILPSCSFCNKSKLNHSVHDFIKYSKQICNYFILSDKYKEFISYGL